MSYVGTLFKHNFRRPKMEQEKDRRINIRIPVNLPVSVRYPDKVGQSGFRTVMRNLCFGGTFIEARESAPPAGTIVRLSLKIPREDSLILDALALRKDGAGLGIIFAYYSDDTFKKLASILEPSLEHQSTHRDRPVVQSAES
jgi:hypothetical protein